MAFAVYTGGREFNVSAAADTAEIKAEAVLEYIAFMTKTFFLKKSIQILRILSGSISYYHFILKNATGQPTICI